MIEYNKSSLERDQHNMIKSIGWKKIILIFASIVLSYQSLSTFRSLSEYRMPLADTTNQTLPVRYTNYQPTDAVSDLQMFSDAFPDGEILQEMESFENLTSLVDLQNVSLPRNLNILFMGDSLTRYQYLDLVYFLSHNGTWVSRKDHPNLVVEKSFRGDWPAFYNFTNSALQPYETCDCFRASGPVKAYIDTLVENRYFYDSERNNTVTYLSKMGNHPFRSSWNLTEIHQNHPMVQNETEMTFVYNDMDWVDVIQNFTCKMSPKPSFVVFNAGLWKNHGLYDENVQAKIVKALKKCQIVSIYKTTTKKQRRTDRTIDTYEQQLCNLTDLCLDVSWTGLVEKKDYWDFLHFQEPAYSIMNIQLLTVLASYENKRQDIPVV